MRFYNRNVRYCVQFTVLRISHKLYFFYHFFYFFVLISKIISTYIFGKIEIPFVEVFITLNCNLSCKECSNLIPDYQVICGGPPPISDFYNEINFLSKYCIIHRLKIHGGEPMLCDELAGAINYCCANKNIKEVRMSTNGTILPSVQLLTAMNNKKFQLFISDYQIGDISILTKLLDSYKVNYRYQKDQRWVPYGDVFNYRYEEKELIEKRECCSMANCLSVLYNKMFLCSRIANGFFQGRIQIEKNDYICFDEPKFRKKLKYLYSANMNSGCKYCGVQPSIIIKAGEQ